MNKKTIKLIIVAVSVILIITSAIGVTYALMSDKTDTITNEFIPGDIDITIEEKFNNNIKSNVTIKNIDNSDAYIRSYVVITWKNDEGEVYPVKPVAGKDYTITWGGTSWDRTTSDGYYYYKYVVKSNQSTSALITRCAPVANKAPEGYHLDVQIIAEGIQSVPRNAVVEAWGVTMASNGTISK